MSNIACRLQRLATISTFVTLLQADLFHAPENDECIALVGLHVVVVAVTRTEHKYSTNNNNAVNILPPRAAVLVCAPHTHTHKWQQRVMFLWKSVVFKKLKRVSCCCLLDGNILWTDTNQHLYIFEYVFLYAYTFHNFRARLEICAVVLQLAAVDGGGFHMNLEKL